MDYSKKKNRRSFSKWLEDAAAYRNTYGNLLVPNDYVTPEGNKLGRWIERKRAQYNGIKSTNGYIYCDEIAALNAIGMVWKLEYRFEWDAWIRQAEIYYDTHGHLDIPKEYVQGEYHLGHWLIQQRKKYAAGELSDKQIANLEQFHVHWKLRVLRSWEEWYKIAVTYYEKNGNLRVRSDYITENGERLGKWICSQRECYYGRHGKRRLLAEEIEKLEKIGIVWSVKREKESVSVLKEAGPIKGTKRAYANCYDKYKIGARIRNVRMILQRSPESAAEDIGLTKQNYTDIEYGTCEMSLDTIMRIASYYRVSLEYLVHGERSAETAYTKESAAILFMLKFSQNEKREKAIKILQAYLTE